MLQLTFKQTNPELVVRAAATVLFGTLVRRGAKLISISDLTEHPQYGFTASAATEPVGPKFVRITDLQDGKIDWESVPFCECAEPEKYLLRDDDLLFARTGATTGKTHLVRAPEPAVFASYLIRLRPQKGVYAGYLHAFFQSDSYWFQISEEKEGSAQPNVNGEKLSALQIPLVETNLQCAVAEFLHCVRRRQDGERVELPQLPAPLAEQRRVVARIEELAAQIHEARTLRQEINNDLDAMLAAAHREIAANAARKPLSEVAPLNRRPVIVDVEKSYPGVAVRSFGRGTFHKPPLVGSEVTWEKPFLVKAGDILVSNIKAWEGALAVAKPEDDGRVGSHRYLTCVPIEGVATPRFVCFHLLTPEGLHEVSEASPGSADRNRTLGAKAFMRIPIPVPEYSQQQRFDALCAEVDALKRLQTETAAELDALLPAILDKAFKGEL